MTETLDHLRSLHSATCAGGPEVPADEIERACAFLDRFETIQVAAALGVVRTLRTRCDALAAIGRKVNEVPLARQSIAY